MDLLGDCSEGWPNDFGKAISVIRLREIGGCFGAKKETALPSPRALTC